MSAHDSNGYFVELGEYSLILAKANLGPKPRAVDDLREVWLGDNAAVDAALKELKGDGEKAKAVALLRLKNRSLVGADATLAKKIGSVSAVEEHLKEALGSDGYPANWAWVSQKDGRPPEPGTPWLLDATATASTDEGVNKITGWAFDLLRCQSASLALVGSLTSAAKTVTGPILLCDVSETRSFLVAISGQGVTGTATIPSGFDAMAEATQGALGLKFRGSAARLMFNESYDFADSAAKIIEPLAVAIRLALPTLGALAPAHLVCSGVLARQTWLTQALATALSLKSLTLDAAGWATGQGLSLSSKISGGVSPSWLGVLNAVAAYDPRNPGAALPWNPVLTNTPVAPAPIVPAIVQEPAPAPKPAAPIPAVVITPPVAPKPAEPVPAIKPEPAKAAPTPAKAPEAPKPAVVITPPPKPVEPPKPAAPAAKTPPPPAKPVEPKSTGKPEPKAAPAPAPAAKPAPATKPEPAKPAPAPAPTKPTLAPAPAPAAAAAKAPTAAPFPKKKSPMPMIIGLIALLAVLGIGGFVYMNGKKKDEEQARIKREYEQRTAQEAAARRAAEEKAAQEAAARKKAEEEMAQKAILAEKARVEAEERARLAAAEQAVNARGSLILNTNPPGATVAVGELAPRPSPIHLKDLRLGKYTVTITLAGYDTEQREIDIKANEVTDLGAIPLKRQTGAVAITSDPAGLDYELKPAGALFVNPADVRKGQTPANLNDIPAGAYQLTITRANWPNYTTNLTVERNGTAKAHGTFVGGTLVINSNPPGSAVMRDQVQIGTTPLTLTDLQPGDVTFTLTQRGLEPATVSGKVEAGKTLTLNGTLLDADRVMRPSELDERPVPIQFTDPELTSSMRAEGGTATIEFVVNKDGTPSEMKILNASNPAFGRACLTATAKWKFRPGMVRGKPVRTRMSAPFKMGPES